MSTLVVEILLFVAFLFFLVYYYGTKSYDFFKKRGVKFCKPPVPFLGSTPKMFIGKETFLNSMDRIYSEYPDQKYVGAYEFTTPIIWLRDIDLIKKVTIKDFEHFVDHRSVLSDNMDPLFSNSLFSLKGQKWKDMRNTLTPAFTSSKIRNMFQFIIDCSDQLVNHLDKTVKKASDENVEAQVNIKEIFSQYTIDVIASNAFGLKIDSFKDKDNEFNKMGMEMIKFNKKMMIKFFAYMMIPKIMNFLKIKVIEDHVAHFFRRIVKSTMATREEQNIYRPDMIQLLMEAKKGSLHSEDSETKVKHSRVWTDDELASQAFLFFIAGFETTSSFLSLASYQLVANPEVQETLRAEIDDVLAEGDVTYDKLMKMTYMDQFISESMRLYPGAPGVDRVCVKDYELPPPNDNSETKFKLEKGAVLFLPIRSIQRDPKYFPDPLKFDPDRFSESRKDESNMNAFIPFGIGPRQCIGNRFALMEIKAILFFLLAKYKLVVCEKTQDPETAPKNMMAVIPTDGIWVGIEPRNK